MSLGRFSEGDIMVDIEEIDQQLARYLQERRQQAETKRHFVRCKLYRSIIGGAHSFT